MKCPKCKTDLTEVFRQMAAKGGKKTSAAKRAAAIKANQARWKDHVPKAHKPPPAKDFLKERKEK